MTGGIDTGGQQQAHGEAFNMMCQKSYGMLHSVLAAIISEWVALLAHKEQELQESVRCQQADLAVLYQQKDLRLQEWEKDLRQREQALEKKLSAAKRSAEAGKEKVCLNVGGTEFITTKETLMTEQGSFFDVMLYSGVWKPDDQGQYFIDRDPTYFGDILNYLRLGKFHLDLEHLSPEDQARIFEELDFYQLQKAFQVLGRKLPPVYGLTSFDPARCHRSIEVSADRSCASYHPDSTNQWAGVQLDVPRGDCSFSFTSESHHFIVVSHDFASLDFPLWPRNLRCFLAGYGTHWTPHTIVPQQNIYTITIKAGKFCVSGCEPPLPMHGVELLFFFKQAATSVSILPNRLAVFAEDVVEDVVTGRKGDDNG